MYTPHAEYVGKSIQSSLERQLIIDFLAEKGYRMEDLQIIPAPLAKELMVAACIFASLRLAEIESRSKFMRKIHCGD